MNPESPPPRRRGRPSLPPDRAKKEPLVLRTTKALKDALAAAAEESGRSLASEIEYRLERSLAADHSQTGEALLESRVADEIVAMLKMVWEEKRSAAERRRADEEPDAARQRVAAEAQRLGLQVVEKSQRRSRKRRP